MRRRKMVVVLVFLALASGVLLGIYLPLPRSHAPIKLEGLTFAHRGADQARTYPENSLAAIRFVHGQGADGIEIDVQLTKDGQLVLMHDLSLEKMTGDFRRVDEVTFDEIRSLSLKHTNDEIHQIPSLEEVIDLCDELGLIINIEMKPVKNPKLLANKLIELFNRKNLYHRAFVSSFEWDNLYQIRKASQKITSVWITEGTKAFGNPSRILYRLAALSFMPKLLGVDAVFPHCSLLLEKPDRADEIKSQGYQLGTWTLNKLEDKEKLQNISKLTITDRLENFTKI